jgi:ribosomal protein S15P/S13E
MGEEGLEELRKIAKQRFYLKRMNAKRDAVLDYYRSRGIDAR